MTVLLKRRVNYKNGVVDGTPDEDRASVQKSGSSFHLPAALRSQEE